LNLVKFFVILTLAIIGGGYVQGNIISVESGEEYTLALIETLDVLLIKKYSPIEILCKAPEKGELHIYGDKVFLVGSRGLYLLENRTFKLILEGNMSILGNYLLFNGSLYTLPQLKKLCEFERVIVKDDWALVLSPTRAEIYYSDKLLYEIDPTHVAIDPQKIVDFHVSSDGIIGIVESSGNISIIKNSTLLARLTYSEKRAIKILDIYNGHVILSIKDSTYPSSSNYTQVVAIYSLKDRLFEKFFIVGAIYYPYAFSYTYFIDLRSGEVFLDNIFSVLDYKKNLILLSLRNNTLALVNVSSGEVLYSHFSGFPYTGSIINESMATVVTRILRDYNYLYIVSFSKEGDAYIPPQPIDKFLKFDIKYVIPFIFFGCIAIIFYIFFLRRPKIK